MILKEVVLIITGSVAAFRALELIRLLVKSGVRVVPVLSRGAHDFVTPMSVSALAGHECLTEDTFKMEHITLGKSCDMIIVCPASASFLARMAGTIGGDLALDLLLAKPVDVPVLVAPAMNTKMLRAATPALEKLSADGVFVVPPEKGELLCKESGEGKLAPIEDVFKAIFSLWEMRSSLKGRKFLVTNGATVEKIDDARFISNFSSGLQGALIARELLRRGSEVFLVQGRVSHNIVLPARGLHFLPVLSAREMHKKALEVCASNKLDGCFCVAAVSDFAPVPVKGKWKKDKPLKLEFELNPDILFDIGHLKKSQRPKVVVGFAAEEKALMAKNGRGKLERKNCDILFANPMCFGEGGTEGLILRRDSKAAIKFKGSKAELAKELVELV